MVPSPSISYSWNAPDNRRESIGKPKEANRDRTFELLVQSATRSDAQSTNKLFEVDCAVLVLVEDVEYIVGEFAGVTKREKLFIYPAELVLVELAGGTVLEEALVPARE